MIELLRSLFAHQAWADSAILGAIQAHPESAHDQRIVKLLHHIVSVQKYYLAHFLGLPFDKEKEFKPLASLNELIPLFRDVHARELAFVGGLGDADLDRIVKFPAPMYWMISLGDGLTQVAMHSQNHRGQCLMRLRENGGKPPTLDYILWAKERPTPSWAVLLEAVGSHV